jgi:hypothetical protein
VAACFELPVPGTMQGLLDLGALSLEGQEPAGRPSQICRTLGTGRGSLGQCLGLDILNLPVASCWNGCSRQVDGLGASLSGPQRPCH